MSYKPSPGKYPEEEKTGSSPILEYFCKMKGGKCNIPWKVPNVVDILLTWLGAFTGIGLVAFLSLVQGMPLLVASFGASAVLVFGVPEAPLAQPRNVIGGHLISALTAVITYNIFGLSWWSAALATATAIVLMLITGTSHPPGGATALVGVLSGAQLSYILTPVGAGAVILVVVGLFTNNLSPHRSYPTYWI